MSQISRRQALRGMVGFGVVALNTSVFGTLVQALVAREARAEGLINGGNRNLIYILHYGAPPRWGFDAFLNPDNNPESILDNGSVRNFLGTASTPREIYTNCDNAHASYQQIQTPVSYELGGVQRQIYLPRLWDALLPEFNGSSAALGSLKMRDLLSQICMIRGVDMQADLGHIKGPALLARPHPTRPSLTGLVADRSVRRLAAVGVTGKVSDHIGFSGKNSGIFRTASGLANPLSDLTAPFLQESSGEIMAHAQNRETLRGVFESVLSQFEVDAKLKHPGAEKFFGSFRNSKQLYDEANSLFSNLSTEYSSRLAKYRTIADRCRTPEGALGLLPQFSGTSTGIYNYAAGLAVSEFLLQKGLSSSITISGGGGSNPGSAITTGGQATAIKGGPGDFLQNDEHSMSCRQASAITYNLLFRVLMASLNEFKRAIGPEEFKDTLVVIGAEYGRNGRADGGGSDHAVGASSVTLFSGMFDGFMPIGNVKRQSALNAQSEHAGSWGNGAPTLLSGVDTPIRITNGEVAATVSDLMGVERPVSGQSLLVRENGTWRSRSVEAPKNV